MACEQPAWAWQPKRQKMSETLPETFEQGDIVCQQSLRFTTLDDPDDDPDDDSDEQETPLTDDYICSDCSRQYPTSHLLSLHVLETHDTMFSILAEKRPMYECFLQTCSQKFMSALERKDHSITVHYYPANFRFTKPVQKSKSKKEEVNSNQAQSEEMEVDSAEKTSRKSSSKSKGKVTYNASKVPKKICFGSGSQRGFNRHWYQQQRPQTETKTEIEDIDMNELAESLT